MKKFLIIIFVLTFLFFVRPLNVHAQSVEDVQKYYEDQGYTTTVSPDGSTVIVDYPPCTNGTGTAHLGEVCVTCGGDDYETPTPIRTPTPTITQNTPTPRNTPTPTLPQSSPTPSKPPTPTVTRPPSATPTTKPSPTVTPTKAPTPTATPQPTNTPTPTFTPTPTPFNAAACTCDGITYTSIGSGKPLTVTSFGKVTGSDTSKAIIQDQKFFLAEGAETLATIIARSDPIPATIVSNTAGAVRYQSVWNLTLPQLKSGSTYRIWSQINCQPKLTAMGTTSTNTKKVVLAASTQRSFIDILLSPFTWIFGGRSNGTAQPTVTPVAVQGTAAEPTGPQSLQLQTIQPVEVYQKTCSFIKFRYNFSAN